MIDIDTPDPFEARLRLTAAAQIMEFERNRSINEAAINCLNAQNGTDDDDDDELLASDMAEFMRQAAIIDEMLTSDPETAAIDAAVLLQWFLEDGRSINATLAFLDMHGEWARADAAEQTLLHATELLRANGYDEIFIPDRDSADAKRIMALQPGIVQDDGLVAIRMKRLLLEARDSTGVKPTLQIDKVSSHAVHLDLIPTLAEHAELADAVRAAEAMREMRLIILANKLLGANFDLLRGLVEPNSILDNPEMMREALPPHLFEQTAASGDAHAELLNLAWIADQMDQYGITKGELIHRSQLPRFGNIQNWQNHLYLLGVMRQGKNGGNLFTPATTSYYVHQVQPAGSNEDSSL